MFVRQELWALESSSTFHPITLAYAKAIQVMQARPADDPTSWVYQAAIHRTYRTPLAGAPWNACQHQSWFFLPWHRMYLYYFERIVRAAVPAAFAVSDFAIPYWNYDRPFPGNTLPPAFRQEATLPDGTANPLFVPSPNRRAALMAGAQVPPVAATSAEAMANTIFSVDVPTTAPLPPTFGGGRVGPIPFGEALGLLETTPHNVMHGLIGGAFGATCSGGLMTDPHCAALDPIFWQHHANIDRLWNVWLALGGDRANPSQTEWRTQTFEFRDEHGATVTLSGDEVVDSAAQLDYRYDDAEEDAPPAVIAAAAQARSRSAPQPPELVGATEAPLELVGDAASVSLTMPDTRTTVEAAASDPARWLFVSVEDITAPGDPGQPYAVYVATPSGERRHVGNVALFGIEETTDPDSPHAGAPGFRHTFDATAAIGALRADPTFDPGVLTVTFEPIRLLPPPSDDLATAAPAAAPEAHAPVRIGRVGLFVA